MKMHALNAALLVALMAGTVACDNRPAPSVAEDAAAGVEASRGKVDQAMDSARRKLAAGNIGVSGRPGQPKAEITPTGDLLVDGKAVTLTPAQRALVLEYRSHLLGVAGAGIEVGAEGAKLAVNAVGEVFRGLATGHPDEIDARVEKRADGVRLAALRICDRLPAMMSAQQKLAAAVPEFAPYATMDDDDVTECRNDHDTPPQPAAPPAPPQPPAPPSPAR